MSLWPTCYVEASKYAAGPRYVRGRAHGARWDPIWTVHVTFDSQQEAERFSSFVCDGIVKGAKDDDNPDDWWEQR